MPFALGHRRLIQEIVRQDFPIAALEELEFPGHPNAARLGAFERIAFPRWRIDKIELCHHAGTSPYVWSLPLRLTSTAAVFGNRSSTSATYFEPRRNTVFASTSASSACLEIT